MSSVNKIVRYSFAVAGVCIGSEIIYQFYQWLKKKSRTLPYRTPVSKRENDLMEVIFFPDQQIACKKFFTSDDGCPNRNCRYTHDESSLSKLYKHLTIAKFSLDICVYVICCADLGDLVIEAHHRGVCVRVITDDEQVDATGSQIWRFRSEGINVRTDHSSFFMHNKFFIVDKRMLLNGSFNWTRNAISGNQENLMITNNTKLISLYLGEFERLWELFDPKTPS